MDNRERTMSIPCQSTCRGCMPSISRRIAMAKAATLGAEARNRVTAVGEPSYTSGNQEWKGTAPSLNAMPTTTKTSPNRNTILLSTGEPRCAASSGSMIVPVTPYKIEIPYNSKPDASAPRTKYFMAASDAVPDSLFIATIAYRESDISSRPR